MVYLGGYLKRLQEITGESVQEMAENLLINQSTLSKYRNNILPVHEYLIIEISQRYGLEAYYAWCRELEKTKAIVLQKIYKAS